MFVVCCMKSSEICGAELGTNKKYMKLKISVTYNSRLFHCHGYYMNHYIRNYIKAKI